MLALNKAHGDIVWNSFAETWCDVPRTCSLIPLCFCSYQVAENVRSQIKALSHARYRTWPDQMDQVLFLSGRWCLGGHITNQTNRWACFHMCWSGPHLLRYALVCVWEQWPCCLPIRRCCWSCLTPVLGSNPLLSKSHTHTHTYINPNLPFTPSFRLLSHTPIHFSSQFTSSISV